MKVLFELVMLVSLQRVHGSIYVSPSAVHDRLRGRADAKRSGPARLPDTAPSAKLGPGAPGTEMCRDLSRSRVSSALRLHVDHSGCGTTSCREEVKAGPADSWADKPR